MRPGGSYRGASALGERWQTQLESCVRWVADVIRAAYCGLLLPGLVGPGEGIGRASVRLRPGSGPRLAGLPGGRHLALRSWGLGLRVAGWQPPSLRPAAGLRPFPFARA